MNTTNMALDSNRQPHIHIIGLGVAEKASLDADATAVLAKADLVIAHPRQLATVAHLPRAEHCQSMALPKLSQLQDLLAPYADKTVVVLASGDPLYFGIGRWFRQHYALQQLCFYPAVSSLQAACHRLGLALQDVTVVSLHGRSVKTLARYLRQQRRLLILTDQHSQPRVLAQACYDAGFDQSVISVCENLGYQDERVRQFQLAQLLDHDYTFMPLHVSFVEVLGPGGVLPEAAGIDDAAFITGAEPGKGMISKREVRLASLAYMQPAAADVIWDIGAGCGGVAVELALSQPRASIYAVEQHPERLQYLAANQEKFGVVDNLHIIAGRAPEVLPQLPMPNKVFIGGSDGELANLLNTLWSLLPPHGLIVATAVLESTQQCLQHFAQQLSEQQVQSLELSIKRGLLKDDQLRYQAKLPVAIFQFTKI